ncbi:NAD(+)/NADH kinase [Gottschalkiaceae bacterium SANA]|nr:NAD(+)/NADH kinase [Gottschalkiaceae bacterium SANA]
MQKIQKINILHNYQKPSERVVDELRKKLLAANFEVSENYDDHADLNICVGGDGVILIGMKEVGFPEIPFIGINTGHLGFFQELCPEDIDRLVSHLKDDDYQLEQLYLVESAVCTEDQCIPLTGINEIVIKGINSKVIHLNINIGDETLESYSGDGIIVSTPMGSTAYNMSAGGSLVYPTLGVLQMTALAPINSRVYRSLTNSVIVPFNMTIELIPEYRDENSILIVVDGVQLTYRDITNLKFWVSERKLTRLTTHEHHFWANIKKKFL